MKRKHKKIVGLFGLVLVAAVTVFAAFLPSPGTLATATSTDTISISVVGDTPTIGDLGGITNGSVSPDGRHTVTIPYSDVESIRVKIRYTDTDGVEHVTTLPDKYVGYETGEASLTFNTLTGEYDLDGTGGTMAAYGYGTYVIEVEGLIGDATVAGPKTVEFETSPAGDGTQIVKEEGTGEGGTDVYYLDVDYDNGEGGGIPGATPVDHLEVKIYDADGNEVKISPITINAPEKRVVIPFDQLGDGTYRIEVTAYDGNGNVIGKSPAYTFWYTYQSEPMPVPSTGDTGGVMGNLNISKTDYIITGLIVFAIIGIAGAVMITKHDKKTTNRRRK